MPRMRLQKYLANAGICSRRKGETYIKNGFIRVNDEIVTQMGVVIDPDQDRIYYKNKRVLLTDKRVYIALNKPKGYITTCRQPGEKIVTELLHFPDRVYPIGRLDKASTGLLLLTNDGELHHRLSHPSFNHEKEYIVTIARPISDNDLLKMAQGMIILGSKTRPARVKRLSEHAFRIILKEGKNRQIRRMVRQTKNEVVHLNRVRIANIHLGTLATGRWRYLTKTEIKGLTSRPTE